MTIKYISYDYKKPITHLSNNSYNVIRLMWSYTKYLEDEVDKIVYKNISNCFPCILMLNIEAFL